MIKYTEYKHLPKYMVDDKLADVEIFCQDEDYFIAHIEEIYQKVEKILDKHLKKNENYRLFDLGRISYNFVFFEEKVYFNMTHIMVRHKISL